MLREITTEFVRFITQSLVRRSINNVNSQTFQLVYLIDVLADKQIFRPKIPSLPLFITDEIDIISQF